MNNRWTTFVAAIALVLLVVMASALATMLIRPQPLAAQQGNGVVRQITVIGTGEAQAAPDMAQVQLGVQTQAATAREALTQNNTQMQALIAKLKELGVADRDLQTSNVSIWPQYDGQTISGYTANNNVSVKIRDLAQTGDLLDQVVSAGANNVNGISFTIAEPAALEQQARDAAIANARTRAEAMAQAAGGSIGQVLSISETIGQAQPLMFEGRAQAADAANVPIEQGEQTISAQVQITFELR
jgi:uncharacterized protein